MQLWHLGLLHIEDPEGASTFVTTYHKTKLSPCIFSDKDLCTQRAAVHVDVQYVQACSVVRGPGTVGEPHLFER